MTSSTITINFKFVFYFVFIIILKPMSGAEMDILRNHSVVLGSHGAG